MARAALPIIVAVIAFCAGGATGILISPLWATVTITITPTPTMSIDQQEFIVNPGTGEPLDRVQIGPDVPRCPCGSGNVVIPCLLESVAPITPVPVLPIMPTVPPIDSPPIWPFSSADTVIVLTQLDGDGGIVAPLEKRVVCIIPDEEDGTYFQVVTKWQPTRGSGAQYRMGLLSKQEVQKLISQYEAACQLFDLPLQGDGGNPWPDHSELRVMADLRTWQNTIPRSCFRRPSSITPSEQEIERFRRAVDFTLAASMRADEKCGPFVFDKAHDKAKRMIRTHTIR